MNTNDSNQRPSWFVGAAIVALIVPVIYVLSYGPVVAYWTLHHSQGGIMGRLRDWIDSFYRPLTAVRYQINKTGDFDTLDLYAGRCYQLFLHARI